MHGPVVRLPVSTLLVIHSGCHTISPEVVPLLTSTSSTLIANTTLISNTRLIILSSTLSGALTGLPAVSVITLASLKLHASSYGPWGESYYWPTIDLVPVCGCPSQVTLSSGIVLPYTLNTSDCVQAQQWCCRVSLLYKPRHCRSSPMC